MKHRVSLLATFAAVCCMLTSVASAQSAPGKASGTRPNIILIMSDDMGISDLGCYGSEIKTPTLNRLAEEGVRFTQFYNTGRCCPTRASLLTGLYPHQAGIGHMMDDLGYEGYRGDLSPDCVTIAEALEGAGYANYMVGKWHVTKNTKQDGSLANWPLQRGFDRFYGIVTGAANFYDPATLCRDNTLITPVNDPEYQPETYYFTDAISDHAVRYIDEHEQASPEQPFFMYVAYTAAHWPMHALPKDIAKYKGRYDCGWDVIREERLQCMIKLGLIDPSWAMTPRDESSPAWDSLSDEEKAWRASLMEVYAAMIDCMDQGIGRIVDELEKTGQLDNTLIFFLQDNGGCAETYGSFGPIKPSDLSVRREPMGPDELQTSHTPAWTRDGRPVRRGQGVIPGPADTAIGYTLSWANASNTPFRRYKHYVHEGGISTPLIMHWPDQVTRHGEWEDTPGHLIDLMATCVDVAGAEYPKTRDGVSVKPMEGRSLMPALQGGEIERDAIYWEHEGNRAIRVGDWKLVAQGATGAWELYNMKQDRTEMHNLIDQEPELAKQLAAKWQAWAERAQVLPLVPYSQPKPKQSLNTKQKRFELKQGDDLSSDKAPYVVNRGLKVTATLAPDMTDGVIVAQGGSSLGWSLYIENGEICFAMANRGKRTVCPMPAKLNKDKDNLIVAELGPTGPLSMKLNDAKESTGADGTFTLLQSQPLDGLQVGRDLQGAVGPYETPNEADGTIRSVTVELVE